jgi:hypothetical protein
VLWIHLNDFGASEFSGGRFTGKLLTMADLSFTLILEAMLLTVFFPRVAPAVALTTTLLCVPFYLYIVMPGSYRRFLPGEYSLPLQRPSVWENWALLGILSLGVAAILSLRSLFKGRARATRKTGRNA